VPEPIAAAVPIFVGAFLDGFDRDEVGRILTPRSRGAWLTRI